MPESRGYRDAIPTLPAGSGAALGHRDQHDADDHGQQERLATKSAA